MQVLVRAHLALEQAAEAGEWVERLEAHVERPGLPNGIARARYSRAALLLASGEPERAAEVALEAAERAYGLRYVIDSLVARLIAGRALAAAGSRDEAVEQLRRVADDAERIGAGRYRDSAARELRQLGVRLSAASQPGTAEDGFAALSEREREIVELVASGRSNKQVAGALFLSEKTIEHHLSKAYAKLGVRSRVELAAAFVRNG